MADSWIARQFARLSGRRRDNALVTADEAKHLLPAGDSTARAPQFGLPVELDEAAWTTQLGTSGLSFGSDRLPIPLSLPELVGAVWYRTVDAMLDDVVVAGMWNAMVNMAVGAEWTIRPGKSREIAEYFADDLFNPVAGMKTVWLEFIKVAWKAMVYGNMNFEIELRRDGDLLHLDGLHAMHAASFLRYEWDPVSQDLCGITQSGWDPALWTQRIITVPVDKLLMVVHGMQMKDYHGQSVLRPLWKSWRRLQNLTNIADIGIDHNMTNVPMAREIAKSDKGVRDAVLNGLSQFRHGRSSAFVWPLGFEPVEARNTSQGVQFLDYICEIVLWMVRCLGVEWLVLGQSSRGTTQVSAVQMLNTGLQMDSVAQLMCASIGRQIIRALATVNFPSAKPEDLPQLECESILELLRETYGSAPSAVKPPAVGEKIAGGTWWLDDNRFSSLPPSLMEARRAAQQARRGAVPANVDPRAAATVGGGDQVQTASEKALPQGEQAAPGKAAPLDTARGEAEGQVRTASEKALPQGDQAAPGEAAPVAAGKRRGRAREMQFAAPSLGDFAAQQAAMDSERAAGLDKWQQAVLPLAQAMLVDLAGQVRLARGDAVKLAGVKVSAGTAHLLGEQIGEWLQTAREQARAARGVTAAPAPQSTSERDNAIGQMTADRLVNDIETAVRRAALRGRDVVAAATDAFNRGLHSQLNGLGADVAAEQPASVEEAVAA